jgi:hypothetical protein
LGHQSRDAHALHDHIVALDVEQALLLELAELRHGDDVLASSPQRALEAAAAHDAASTSSGGARGDVASA